MSDKAVVKMDPVALTRAATLILEKQMQFRPVHIHTCVEGHPWPCPSPYCEDVNRRALRCPGHGGDMPRDTSADDFVAGGA